MPSTWPPNRLLGLLPILALVGLWQAVVSAGVYPPVLLPSPAKVAGAFVQWGPVIATNALASLGRVALGVSLAFLVGVPAGLLIGRYPVLDRLADWSIQTFRSVPPISLIPLAMLFFGIGDTTSIVFQDHGLFPWMTVQRNVEFNMKARGTPRAGRRARATEMLALTGLQAFAARYPHELSGGMRQRVGIARALTTRPRALLMDEPFGALDAQTRSTMQAELLQIWAQQRTTVLFVTHSIDEAIVLADRVLVFTPRPGRLAADIPVPMPRPRDPRSPDSRTVAAQLRAALGADASSE